MKAHNSIKGRLAITLAVAVLLTAPAQAHHSFAMYDLRITKVFTGVVTRVDPAPNHLTIYFAPMNAQRTNVERDADGKPVMWSVEMGGSAMMARQGISVHTYSRGTIFSVGLHPLRSGKNAGSREGGIFRCPPKMHCDSVKGNIASGKDPLAKPMNTHKK